MLCVLLDTGNNNKDEVNSPKTFNDKNNQASSQKFRQLTEKERLVRLYAISTTIGYLMALPVYTYIKYIQFVKNNIFL